MEQIPNIWRDLRLDLKDDIKNKELRKSLLEEEKIDEHNIIRTESQNQNKKKQPKLHLIMSHCIIS